MKLFKRLKKRMLTSIRFASHGLRVTDKFKLFVAGIARERPFDRNGPYGRFMAFLFPSVVVTSTTAPTMKVTLDLTDLVDTIVFEELAIEEIYPFDKLSFIPNVVIDAGACRGLFTLLAADRFPNSKYYCIEPEQENFERLSDHLAMNRIEGTLIQAVISKSNEPVAFSGRGFGGSVVATSTANCVFVESIQLESLLEGCSNPQLLMKMDIEGSEKEVLPAILDRLPEKTFIFLETHDAEDVVKGYLNPYLKAGFTDQIIRERVDGSQLYVERVLYR